MDKTDAAIARIVADLNAALAAGDAAAAAALFTEPGYWRDVVAFTWNIRTCESRAEIAAMLEAQLPAIRPQGFALNPAEPVTVEDGLATAWLTFATAQGRGTAVMRVRDGRIFTLLTHLDELTGFEEPKGNRRPLGARHFYARGGAPSWAEARAAEEAALGRTVQPEVVIIGGGQGGIALGARLRQLGVPTIILERNARAGDSWRNRYRTLALHDPVWYDHLPYIPFPENWPVFSPKDKIGDWLEFYARVMELTYWTRSTATRAAWDEAEGRWRVEVDRDGEALTLHPRQLVLATGMSGKPNLPQIPGMDRFRGEQHHSSRHPGPEGWAGKRAVVVGSNNSAHDICAALWEAGAEVTMVQRSSTMVLRSDTLMEMEIARVYSEAALARGITTQKADMLVAAEPYAIKHVGLRKLTDAMRAKDAAFYAALEKAGFRLDYGDDDSGLTMKYLRRGSGYYIDVGASQLIIDGSIGLAQGQVAEVTEDGLRLEDGSFLPADLIVWATGYGSMNGWAADLIGQEAADRIGKVWGLGSGTTKDPGPWEGEPRAMWKPLQVPNLWLHGGNLHQSRHYSLALALQLKARMEGLPVQVWGLAPVHHLR